MSKLWKAVHNELLMGQAEKRAAQGAQAAQEKNKDYGLIWDNTPNPPSFRMVMLPAAPPASANGVQAQSTAEPVEAPPRRVLGPSALDGSGSVPGAESDLAEAIARERRELWTTLAKHGMEDGDNELVQAVHNELLMGQAEKRAAQGAQAAQEKNKDYGLIWDNTPNPPSFRMVMLPAAPPASANGVQAQSTAEPVEAPPRRVLGPSALDGSGSVPGAESDLAEAIARERRELWTTLAKHGMEDGDNELVQAVTENLVFPVVYTPTQQGGLQAEIRTLDWKMLSQLRATVGTYGVTSEPARQMMEYLFSAHILLPADIRGIARLIYTPHQLILFNAHWQQEAAISAAVQRGPGDPLAGITIEQLMGLGAWTRIEAQAISGPDVSREIMAVARRAMDKIKAPGGTPIYMGIRQGREEPLGDFVDKVMDAIKKASVPEYMQGALLKQCVLQNGNSNTRSLVNTLPGDWSIPELLEKAATVPSGTQAFLVNALQKIGDGLREQARALQEQSRSAQTQVLAALAPLQATVSTGPHPRGNPRMKCFRCGNVGHIRG
uniref:Retroviral nucleocapsid Gag protein p24 C-terminal domain-containing protein n=1 Tax=Gallus gallus TaxID=9031 RepID=A0A8V0WZE5_CHICK